MRKLEIRICLIYYLLAHLVVEGTLDATCHVRPACMRIEKKHKDTEQEERRTQSLLNFAGELLLCACMSVWLLVSA